MAVNGLRQSSQLPSRLELPVRRAARNETGVCRGSFRQRFLFCLVCGGDTLYARELCRRCYNADDHSRRYFSGFRREVLERDGWRCRVCGTWTNVVHHRRPGHDHPRSLISLCPAHHAVVTRLLVLDRCLSSLLLLLWREQHPHAPEQMLLTRPDGEDHAGENATQTLWIPDAVLPESFPGSRPLR